MTSHDDAIAPRVSVVMNAHNSSEFLDEAIASVVSQTMPSWEIVLWDNASTDNSRDIAGSFNDARIRYFSIPDKVSLYESRMAAVGACRGDFICFLDCDDTWMPEKLERQLAVFSDPACVISCTDFVISREYRNEDPIRRSLSTFDTYRTKQSGVLKVLRNYRLGMSSIMVRGSSARAAWLSRPPAFFMIEDVDMVGRIMTQGELVPVTLPLMTYRRHGNNYSSRQDPFAREWETWVENLDSYAVSDSERAGLVAYGHEQSARARYRAMLLAGERGAALHASRQVPWSLTRLKMLAALILPTSFAWQLVH